MDPISTAVASAGADAAAEAAKGFFSKIAGPAAEELGLLFADRIRHYRFRNQLSLLERTERMLNDANISPTQAPLRILLPLLEGASLEDDPGLQEKWAALLANAASPAGSSTVLPSFPTIMRQLAPLDIAVLDVLFAQRAAENPDTNDSAHWGTSRDSLYVACNNVPTADVDLILDNLIGLGLGEREPPIRVISYTASITDSSEYRLSQLGMRFVAACQPPTTEGSVVSTSTSP